MQNHSRYPSQLCDILSSEISKDPAATTTGARLDVMSWLNRTTLDIIGLAGKMSPVSGRMGCHSSWLGFNYNFDALNANKKPNELNEAFATMFSTGQRPTILHILQAQFPLLRILVSTMSNLCSTGSRLALGDSLLIMHAKLRLRNAQWHASAKSCYRVLKLPFRQVRLKRAKY